MSQFEYVAVLISIIVGLALTQLLRGVGRMVVTKDGPRAYWVHLIWTLYLFINTALFWWWEFRLDTASWALGLYLVIIIYATLFFFASLVLQPGKLEGVRNYKEYYYSRRRWIFGLLIALALWDFVDTLSKGVEYFLSYGIEYPVRQLMLVTASVVAIITANERYHAVFATLWMIVFVVYMIRVNYVIG